MKIGGPLLLGLLLCRAAPAQEPDPNVVAAGLGATSEATRMLFAEALRREQARDWKKAAAGYELVLRRDPALVPAVLGLGRVREALGETGAAITAYARLPADADAVAALARLVQKSDPARAATLFHRLQTLRLGDPEPYRQEAAALTAMDPAAALDPLDRWLTLLDEEVEPDGLTMTALAAALREQGLEDEAVGVLRAYLGRAPEGSHAVEARGRLDRIAVERTARSLAVGGDEPLSAEEAAEVNAARAQAAKGDLEGALKRLRAVAPVALRSAEFHGAMGELHAAQGEVVEAERAFVLAAALDPEESTWQARLGLLLANSYGGRRHAEAAEALQRALALRPSSAEIAFGLGRVRQEQGAFDDAIAAYRMAATLEPEGIWATQAEQRLTALTRPVPAPAELPEPAAPPSGIPAEALAHYRIARVYLNEGDRAAARAELMALEHTDAPPWPAVINLGAVLSLQEGDVDRALAEWRRSLEVDPAQPRVRLVMAEALASKGHMEEARTLWTEAAPGAPEAWLRLAQLEWQDFHLLEARRDLDAYFAAAPGGLGDEPARALREEVEGTIHLIERGVAGAIGLLSLGLAWIIWRRRSGLPLSALVEAAPEAAQDLSRVLGAIRHEVLKHNTTLLDEVALAITNGDLHAVAYAAERLFGARGEPGVVQRFEAYVDNLEGIGRRHGLRLDLRRRDPVLGPMHRAMRELARLAPRLRRPQRAGASTVESLGRLSTDLNETGYRALGSMLRELGALTIEAELLLAVDARVRAEPGMDGHALPALALSMPEAPLVARVFRGDLEDILANLLRNALLALVSGVAAPDRRIALHLWEDEDPITGLEHVVFEIRDNAPGRLDTATLRGRSPGRGLGLVVELCTRHDGSIEVEGAPTGAWWTKALVVRLPRAEIEGGTP